jgi:hypothetical protein
MQPGRFIIFAGDPVLQVGEGVRVVRQRDSFFLSPSSFGWSGWM